MNRIKIDDQLLSASIQGNLELVIVLIEQGATVLNDCLVWSKFYGHLDVVEYFI